MAKRTTKPRMPKEAQEVQDKLKDAVEKYETRELKEKAQQKEVDGVALRVAEELASILANMRKMANPSASKLSALEKAVKDLRRIFS